MKLSVIALLSTLSLVSGAWAAQEENEQTAGGKGTAPGQPAGYARVSDDDKQMDRAVENAQKTPGFFIAA